MEAKITKALGLSEEEKAQIMKLIEQTLSALSRKGSFNASDTIKHICGESGLDMKTIMDWKIWTRNFNFIDIAV